jgi:hypothetical protein
LRMDERHVQPDICTHLDWHLHSDDRLAGIKTELKNEIRDKLLAKSAGM